MSSKAAIVFWIGLFLIFANFWISGQSSAVWALFTGKVPSTASAPKAKLKIQQPGPL